MSRGAVNNKQALTPDEVEVLQEFIAQNTVKLSPPVMPMRLFSATLADLERVVDTMGAVGEAVKALAARVEALEAQVKAMQRAGLRERLAGARRRWRNVE